MTDIEAKALEDICAKANEIGPCPHPPPDVYFDQRFVRSRVCRKCSLERSSAKSEVLSALPKLLEERREWMQGVAFDPRVRQLCDDKVKLLEKIERLRAALLEMKGMLSAHEHAIRADAGNTNWQCMVDKVSVALEGK